MQADEFEWDEPKASENYAKHGVSFEAARAVFKDAFAVEELDDREDYAEERFTIVGMSRCYSWPSPRVGFASG
jgi:uncharacterized DUF497 family protein